MQGSIRAALSKTTPDFARTHCQTCAYGWTRATADGDRLREITVCLLDREPVLADLKTCSRYEKQEAREPPHSEDTDGGGNPKTP